MKATLGRSGPDRSSEMATGSMRIAGETEERVARGKEARQRRGRVLTRIAEEGSLGS